MFPCYDLGAGWWSKRKVWYSPLLSNHWKAYNEIPSILILINASPTHVTIHSILSLALLLTQTFIIPRFKLVPPNRLKLMSLFHTCHDYIYTLCPYSEFHQYPGSGAFLDLIYTHEQVSIFLHIFLYFYHLYLCVCYLTAQCIDYFYFLTSLATQRLCVTHIYNFSFYTAASTQEALNESLSMEWMSFMSVRPELRLLFEIIQGGDCGKIICHQRDLVHSFLSKTIILCPEICSEDELEWCNRKVWLLPLPTSVS